jgi:hypothetical protein
MPSTQSVLMSVDHSSQRYPVVSSDIGLEWLTNDPENVGFTRLGAAQRLYLPSLYHELHCLHELVLTMNGNYTTATGGHSRHCLNYLRQMALCQADDTLEPVLKATDKSVHWDVTASVHICEDWTAPMREMERNYRLWKAKMD